MNRTNRIRKFGHSMVNITSSCGDFVVNAEGYVLFPYSLPHEYRDITRMDMKRLEKMCLANHIPLRNEWDILAVGYWTEDGKYEEPAPDYSETGCMRHIWNGAADGLDEAYAIEYDGEDDDH